MRSLKQRLPGIPLAKQAMAALLLVVFLALHAISSSSALHRALHHDAASSNHDCVFVKISSGHCLGAVQPVTLPAQHITIVAAEFISDSLIVSRDCPILSGRAPPASLA
jgi:hypothetical protein